MPRGRKPKGFSVVSEEPTPMPEANIHVLKTDRVPEFEAARKEILSEYKGNPVASRRS